MPRKSRDGKLYHKNCALFFIVVVQLVHFLAVTESHDQRKIVSKFALNYLRLGFDVPHAGTRQVNARSCFAACSFSKTNKISNKNLDILYRPRTLYQLTSH